MMKRFSLNPTADEVLEEAEPIPFSGCMILLRSLNSYGYARLRANKKEYLAHRYVWEKINGTIPIGMYICHTCDNPPCINPRHLFLGTPKDNYIDMLRKGRSAENGPPTSGRFKSKNNFSAHQVGSKHPNAKLTELDVLEIRASKDNAQVLSKKYKISERTVRKIIKKERWRHV